VHRSSYGYSATLRIDPDYGSTTLRAQWVRSRQNRLDDGDGRLKYLRTLGWAMEKESERDPVRASRQDVC
jgi:hypothetical protein